MNPHALLRALAPQASASAYSATRTGWGSRVSSARHGLSPVSAEAERARYEAAGPIVEATSTNSEGVHVGERTLARSTTARVSWHCPRAERDRATVRCARKRRSCTSCTRRTSPARSASQGPESIPSHNTGPNRPLPEMHKGPTVGGSIRCRRDISLSRPRSPRKARVRCQRSGVCQRNSRYRS